jgi:hypothetical protein
MARLLSLRGRFGARPAESVEPTGGAAPPAPTKQALPPTSVLKRERRLLGKERETRIRDLGGLILEMYRRDRFRDELVAQQCADLVALEARIEETAMPSAGGDRFLAGVQVDEPGDLTRGELGVQALLEVADRAHHAIGLEQLLLGQLSGSRWCYCGHWLLP